MRNIIFRAALSLAVLWPLQATAGDIVASFDMALKDGCIVDAVSGSSYEVATNGSLAPLNVKGARGEALRFDGYANYIVASLPEKTLQEFTFSAWIAPEGYPMMNATEAETTPTFATVAGCLDENGKTGFALQLSSQGDLKAKFYSKKFPGEIVATEKVPLRQWSHIVLTLKTDGKLYLYNNGALLGSTKTMGEISLGAGELRIGKSADTLKSGEFNINTFCGLIDDICLYDTEESSVIADNTAENAPDFAYPASRYEEGGIYSRLWRPSFHAMPSGSWTNECHGMAYSGGRYHLFFQKNPNGPYMARLNWGHLSSADLCHWQEENIAFSPSETYDIKGCWSGCVYKSESLTGGEYAAFYTAVDNGKASIAMASPQDVNLEKWAKRGTLIGSKPAGLSDDFRDCYLFEAGGTSYMIVGTSKDGIGACTLHSYNGSTWTNDGSIFFKGASQSTAGRFWEMPNLTPMGNGTFLFTATPLETSVGVETLYWVGTVNADGTFSSQTPLEQPGKVELDGFAKGGFGMLSPTVFQKDGQTLALGIVPDKLPSAYNYQMGWAHNYSLPRLWEIEDGSLVQKPYDGLSSMRTSTTYNINNVELFSSQDLGDVRGREVEVEACFEVGSAPFGLTFLNSSEGGATLSYNPSNNMLTLDLTKVQRVENDGGSFDGVYQTALPVKPAVGETLKMHVFFDHSIFDIFIADRWAASVRVFPTDETADGVQVYADGTVTVKSLSAYVLDGKQTSGIGNVAASAAKSAKCYNLSGQCVTPTSKGLIITKGEKRLRM